MVKILQKIWNLFFILVLVSLVMNAAGNSAPFNFDKFGQKILDGLINAIIWSFGTGMFPVLFITMWLLISYAISLKSGWGMMQNNML